MKIVKVTTHSLGEAIGLHPGDRLLRINGRRVKDEIDYQFRMTEESLVLELDIAGKLDRVEVEKEYDDDLGVEFEEMKVRSCANDCVFCFVDQNPEGMRDGMYFRDGDYRMSYLHGHYITMTNMGQQEMDRVVEQRMSPLYISVHVTEPKLRHKLFLYKKDDRILDKLKFLTDNNIELHTQIVLMPTINDGDYLSGTLADLYQIQPNLKSCTIVPVGLTRHRKGLMEIPTVSKNYAKSLLKELPRFREQFPVEISPFVLFSDEWYILAEEPFPSLSDYGGVDLAENGVGQVQEFLNRFHNEAEQFPGSLENQTNITLATGTLTQDIFHQEVIPVLNKVENLNVTLTPVTNTFFGESVTVTGLLTGKDIISQLAGQELGDGVWMSHRILNDEGTLTLDDMTLEDISKELNCPLSVGTDSFIDLFKGLNHV